MVKKFTKWAMAAAVVTTMTVPATAAFATAPAPTLHNDNTSGNEGDWYTGAIPSNVDYNKPVILFVQGLHSNYGTWVNSSGDDYYTAAYNSGYRTAFVQLGDADGTGHDMWDNGYTLSNVIEKVANYYHVPQINIVAHSKGGIDTQTALAWYDAYPYVNVVHQLSTPNLGSELADMSYGSWTWWIGAIMGQQDDAVYSLQTSYMSWYRDLIDPLEENDHTVTWESGGTGDDGWFSATWYAHAVLPDQDDGAVAIYSAFGNPNGYYSFIDDGSKTLSHGMMAKPSNTWWQVEPCLTTYDYYNGYYPSLNSTSKYGVLSRYATASTNSLAALPTKQKKTFAKDETSNVIMRGGAINGTAQDTFTLESGLNKAGIDIVTAKKGTQVKLISPSGKVYTPTMQGQNTDESSMFFANAVHNNFAIDKPEKGTWQVVADGSGDAYFLLANLDGGVKAKVKGGKKVASKKDALQSMSFSFDGGKIDPSHIKNAKLVKAAKDTHNSTILQDVALQADGQGGLTTAFQTPAEPGVYNLSFDVTGTTDKGEAFTRSVNYNFAVTDDNGQLDAKAKKNK